MLRFAPAEMARKPKNRKFIIFLVVTTDNFGFIILMTKRLFLVSILLGSPTGAFLFTFYKIRERSMI